MSSMHEGEKQIIDYVIAKSIAKDQLSTWEV